MNICKMNTSIRGKIVLAIAINMITGKLGQGKGRPNPIFSEGPIL
jgi:hypothetical protein